MKSKIKLIALKELKANFSNQKGLLNILIFSIVLSAFGLLFISNAELSLLDEAQVIYMLVGVITAIASVICIIIGADSFAGEKDRATLVPLLISPLTKMELVTGKAIGMLLVWLVLFFICIPYIWALGSTGQNMVQAIIYLGLFGTPLVMGFGLLAMSLSSRTGNILTSLVSSFIIFMLSASPLLISPGLRTSKVGRLLDSINPFACAVNTFDSVIIDSQAFGLQVIRFSVIIIFVGLMFYFAYKNTKNMQFK